MNVTFKHCDVDKDMIAMYTTIGTDEGLGKKTILCCVMHIDCFQYTDINSRALVDMVQDGVEVDATITLTEPN